MAGLCWMAVTLGLLLSVGNSSADVEGPSLSQLKKIVDELWERYSPSYTFSTAGRRYPMFSLAVSIPYNNNYNKNKDNKNKDNNMYDFSQVINSNDDSPANVIDSIVRCKVYKSRRVVAATVLKWPDVLDQCPNEEVQWSIVQTKCDPKSKTWADLKANCPHVVCTADHAEYRVLQNFDTLTNNPNQNDFLLFYVLSSPCGEKCTNDYHESNILETIKEIKKWNNYAFVFSNVFEHQGVPVTDKQLIGALQRLGGSIGLNNIYRCSAERCGRCAYGNKGDVNQFCYRRQ